MRRFFSLPMLSRIYCGESVDTRRRLSIWALTSPSWAKASKHFLTFLDHDNDKTTDRVPSNLRVAMKAPQHWHSLKALTQNAVNYASKRSSEWLTFKTTITKKSAYALEVRILWIFGFPQVPRTVVSSSPKSSRSSIAQARYQLRLYARCPIKSSPTPLTSDVANLAKTFNKEVDPLLTPDQAYIDVQGRCCRFRCIRPNGDDSSDMPPLTRAAIFAMANLCTLAKRSRRRIEPEWVEITYLYWSDWSGKECRGRRLGSMFESESNNWHRHLACPHKHAFPVSTLPMSARRRKICGCATDRKVVGLGTLAWGQTNKLLSK